MAGLPGDFWVNDIGIPPIPTGFDLTNWDKLWLGDIPKAWPGVCKLEAMVGLETEHVHYVTPESASLPIELQEQKIYSVDKGYSPAKLRATLMIWDRISWISLKAFMASVAPDVTSKIRTAYGIQHPAASLLGVKLVIVDGFVVHPPEDQTLYLEILMTQWFEYQTTKNVRTAGGATGVAAAAPDAGGNLA